MRNAVYRRISDEESVDSDHDGTPDVYENGLSTHADEPAGGFLLEEESAGRSRRCRGYRLLQIPAQLSTQSKVLVTAFFQLR